MNNILITSTKCIRYFFLLILGFVMVGCAVPNRLNHPITGNKDLNKFIQEKINSAGKGKLQIMIPKGTYHFYESEGIEKELYISNHDQKNPKKVGIMLENLNNIEIDAKGSKFIFHGEMLPIVLRNSDQVTLTNFSIDFELPQIRQLEVLNIDRRSDMMEVKLYPSSNYELEHGKLIFTDGKRKLIPEWIMPFKKNHRLSYGRADLSFKPEKIIEKQKDIFQIQGWDQTSATEIGDRFAMRTYERPTPGIFLDNSKNTLVKNVTVHFAEGMGLLAQVCENIHLDGFKVALKDNDIRYFTTQADATHFSGCKGLILSENGLYEGMADDAINVHGTYLKVEKAPAKNAITARYMHDQSYGFKWGEVGDTIHFIRTDIMQTLKNSQFKIVSIEPSPGELENGVTSFEITFDRDLPREVLSNESYAIENLTWTPMVIFRDNVVRNNRARGSLFSTPKRVVCENNVFDHTHGSAILLCGDANGWYETGACQEVIIRNNKFINSLTAQYQFTNAIISIYPEIPKLEEQTEYFHSNILIENNVFETFDQPLLYAKSTKGIYFKNNTVKKNREFKPFHWNKFPFFFERVADVVIEGNRFPSDFGAATSIRNEMGNGEKIIWKNNLNK